MNRFRFSCAALAVVAVGLIASCGGDDGGSDEEDFLADADATCIDTAEQVNALFAEEGAPQTFEEAVALSSKRLPISRESVEAASEVEAPDDLSDEYDAYLTEREEFLQLLEEQTQAGEAGDEQAYQSYDPRIEAQSDATDAAAEEVGLEACAGILPDDQVSDVEAVVEDTATTGDPAHCTDDYTENFVDVQGGLEACEKGEQDPANQAESAEITDVSGVDEVTARAEVTLTGGSSGGGDFFVELVFEDGRWKVDAVFPAVPPDETPGE